MQGEKPFEPKAFYCVNLDAMVPKDNFYRRLNTVLDLRWLRKETRQYYGKEGQKSIDPEVFLALFRRVLDQYRKRRVEKHHAWTKEAYKGQPGQCINWPFEQALSLSSVLHYLLSELCA